MKSFLIVVGMLAVFLCGPTLAQSDATIPVTLKELLDNYKKYDGKTVRVRGQIDNCVNLAWPVCHICEEDMTRDSRDGICLGLELEGFSGGKDGDTAIASINEAFRFAIVTLDARFDSRCINNYIRTESLRPKIIRVVHIPRQLAQNEIVCLDTATMLDHGQVRAVHSRKNALTGIVSWFDYGDLSAPSNEDRQPMLDAFKALLGEGQDKREIKVFRIQDNALLDFTGLACIGFEEPGKNKWPDRYFGGFASPANPFDCYEMRKKDGVWRVLPN